MNNQPFTYKLNGLIYTVLGWEIIFWALYFGFTSFIGSSSVKSNSILFKNPAALNLLVFTIVLIGFYLWNIRKHNRLIQQSSPKIVHSFFKPVSSTSSFIKYFLLRNAFVFLVLALAQPIYGKKKVKGTSESMELVVSLDISNSMNSKDVSKDVSRIEIAKRALIQLVNNLHGEKIGINLFAQNAFVQLPITRDYTAAKMFISDIETTMLSNQGTNITEALRVSQEMFSKDKVSKGIILITDGENHEENPDEILSEIKESNIHLSVLGIGTSSGGLVPKDPYRPELGYKTNAVGTKVISKLDPSFIKSIASKAGGSATISSNEFPNLSGLLTEINKLKRSKIHNLEFDIKQERYQIPLVIALIFWLAYILWSNKYARSIDGMIQKK